MSTASLEGRIVINTKSIEDAHKSVEKLRKQIINLSKGSSEYGGEVDKALKQSQQSYEKTSEAVKKLQHAVDGSAAASQRQENLIAKAANTVANFNQRIKQTVTDTTKQNALIARASGELNNYTRAVQGGADSGMQLQTVNTQLTVALGQLTREMRENVEVGERTSNNNATNERAIGSLQVQYERLTAQVKSSALSDEAKATALSRLRNQLETAQKSIQLNTSRSLEGVKAQNQYKLAATEVTQQMREANRAFRGQEIVSFHNRMRDLSSSVQVALGPLSGVASRLTAMTALFRRNGISIAALIGSMTGFVVTLGATLRAGAEAEQQMLSLDAQINALGMSAFTSGEQLNQMAHDIAAATLTSASEVRKAQMAMLEFENISVSAFEETIVAAQGMANAFGGSLSRNATRLGRLLEDPINNFDSLRRQGISFNEEEKERIRTLQESGRLFEAQSVIMQRFGSLQDAAKNSAMGLSGAIDAVGDNMAYLFEQLFTVTDAGGEAANVVALLAENIREFADSEGAIVLAQTFSGALSAAGKAAAFFSENMKFGGYILTAFAGAAAGKAILSLTVMMARMVGLTTAVRFASTALAGKSANTVAAARAMDAASVSARRLTIAMGAVKFAVGAAFALGAVLLFNRAMSNAGSAIEALVRTGATNFARLSTIRTELANQGLDELFTNEIAAVERSQNAFNAYSEELKQARSNQEELDKTLASLTRTKQKWDREASKESRALGTTSEDTKKEQKAAEVALARQQALYDANAATIQRLTDKATEYNEATIDGIKTLEEATGVYHEQGMTIDQLNTVMQTSIDKAQQLTSADTQRIASAKELRKTLTDQLETAIRLAGAESDQAQQLRTNIKSMDDYIQKLQQSTEAARKAEQQNRQMINIQNSLSEAQDRLNAFKNSGTKIELDATLAQIERNKRMNEMVATLGELTKAQVDSIASTLEVKTGEMSHAEAVEATAKAYREQIATMSEAEAVAQRNFQAQQAFQQMQTQQLTGIAAVNAAYTQQVAVLNQLTDADERKAALGMAEIANERQKADLINQAAEASRIAGLSELERLKLEYEQRKLIIQEALAGEEDLIAEHLESLEQQYKKQEGITQYAQAFSFAGDIVGGAMEAMQAAGLENSKVFARLAQGQAVIQAAQAILGVYADPSMGTYQKIAMSAVIGAKAGAQVAQIQSQSFSTGGFVSGKGTSTSDSIPAWLSDGEFVMSAKAVNALGIPTLNALNQGIMPKFNTGGSVGRVSTPNVISSSTGTQINVSIVNQGGGEAEIERTEQSIGPDGIVSVKVFVRQALNELMAEGQMDGMMGENFGVSRRARRR